MHPAEKGNFLEQEKGRGGKNATATTENIKCTGWGKFCWGEWEEREFWWKELSFLHFSALPTYPILRGVG